MKTNINPSTVPINNKFHQRNIRLDIVLTAPVLNFEGKRGNGFIGENRQYYIEVGQFFNPKNK